MKRVRSSWVCGVFAVVLLEYMCAIFDLHADVCKLVVVGHWYVDASSSVPHQIGVSNQLCVLNYGVACVGNKEKQCVTAKVTRRVRSLHAGLFNQV